VCECDWPHAREYTGTHAYVGMGVRGRGYAVGLVGLNFNPTHIVPCMHQSCGRQWQKNPSCARAIC